MQYIQLENILFTGRQKIQWDEVEKYLKTFLGANYAVKEYGDVLHINALFADEYSKSQYTKRLRGSLAKVKANMVQILPQLIENATNRRWLENKSIKHANSASRGWYRYDKYFSVPVQAENESDSRRNFYVATLVVRINDQGLFLYDVINIKKEASKPREL